MLLLSYFYLGSGTTVLDAVIAHRAIPIYIPDGITFVNGLVTFQTDILVECPLESADVPRLDVNPHPKYLPIARSYGIPESSEKLHTPDPGAIMEWPGLISREPDGEPESVEVIQLGCG